MQRGLIRLWQVCCFPLLVTLVLLPVPLLMGAYFAPEYMPWIWVWPVGYVLLESFSVAIRGKWRILYGALELAVMIAIAVWMAPKTTHWCIFAIPLVYAVILLVELPKSQGSKLSQAHLAVFEVIGILAHVTAQLFCYSADIRNDPVLDAVSPWLLISFFLAVLIALVLRNETAISHISDGRLLVNAVMKRKNLLLTLALFGIAVAIACIPAVLSAAKGFFLWVFSALQWAVGMLLQLFTLDAPQIGSSSGTTDQTPPAIGGEYEPSAFRWDSVVITIIALVFVAVLMCWALYWLGKRLVVLARILYKKLNRYLHAVSEDYVDEITDIREENDRAAYRSKQQKKLSGKDVRNLPPDQRIRYRYWLLMRKHTRWLPGSTARENLNTTAASIYERVRYSDYPASEADDQRFAEEIKTI